MTIATFSAGCFWGVEEKFRQFHGVLSTRVGYTAGHTNDPVYKTVCTGNTGHAEAIEITFDPTLISYEDLLDIFWKIHNPTTLNSQGPDIGTQYRSVVFFHNQDQRQHAFEMRQQLTDKGTFKAPIITIIEAADRYYIAEDYHQKYLSKRGKTSCYI